MKIATIDYPLKLDLPSIGRSPGLHVSDIYGSLYKTLQPSRYAARKTHAEKDEDYDPIMVALGLAWESHVERALTVAGVRAERPGEFFSPEGIAFSPDLLIDNGHTMVGEIKFTRYKMGYYHDEKFAKWVTQMKAYCYHLKTPYARLFALHMGGDYRFNRKPTFVVTDFTFTEKELAREWQLLLSHARQKGLL